MSGSSRPEQAATRDDPVFQVNTSRGFTAWLKQSGASLAVTTYQVGKLLLFGTRPNETLWVSIGTWVAVLGWRRKVPTCGLPQKHRS